MKRLLKKNSQTINRARIFVSLFTWTQTVQVRLMGFDHNGEWVQAPPPPPPITKLPKHCRIKQKDEKKNPKLHNLQNKIYNLYCINKLQCKTAQVL